MKNQIKVDGSDKKEDTTADDKESLYATIHKLVFQMANMEQKYENVIDSLKTEIRLLSEKVNRHEATIHRLERVHSEPTDAIQSNKENAIKNIRPDVEDASDLFNDVLVIAKEKISKSSFEIWLANLTAYKELNTDRLIIVTDNEFQREWVEERYSNLLEDIIQGNTGRKYTLTFDVKSTEGEGLAK
ncbi:DnaA N-terminal domain-containing protein [Alkalihalobacterium elongatum]|uniref:DnaA N-terminal domain-containing protein n=1 Tax=Alkalihalobacterium elongatum TaxID=2675466 RepID=UPI001C1F6CFF|nr:DnaA N-terminal domain-containing protein [Alkalihalobacterium elongatum]